MSENREWIRRIWSHHWEALRSDTLWRTDFLDCLRATVAILLNRWDEAILEYDQSSEPVAWKDNGTYETDFGTGHSFLSLNVKGLRVAILEDGDL